ncbi:glycosyltransferase [Methanococcoides vulcani]|nr:glycosyltransferase [Methanococcoides vulcani]
MINLLSIWQFLLVFEIVLFSSYTLIMYMSSKKKEELPDIDNLPTVTLIIPMYNEEKVIKEKIENTAQLDYPHEKLQVVLLDDYSTDKSEKVSLDTIGQTSLNATVVKNEGGKGKARGLNWIFSSINSGITVISDADALLKEDSLLEITKNYVDPEIGGVTGKIIILSDKTRMSKSHEDSYRFYFDIWRQGESNIDSVSVCNGPLMSFRTSILKKIKIDPNAYADDSDMLFKIIGLGYRVIYEQKAIVYERVPLSFKGRTIQKMKRINGLRKVYLNNYRLIGKGGFGKVIYPYALLTHIISPIAVLGLVFLYPAVVFSEPLYGFFLLFFILPKLGGILVSFMVTQFIMNFSFLVPTSGSWEAVEDARYSLDSNDNV